MNRYISIYLDLVRFLAAVVVFFVHANYDRFTSNLPVVWRFRDLGNDAVMVFFVLSGFVIAYVADQKEKTPREYFISRFARLYSVAVPALLFTVAIDHIGAYLVPNAYDGWWFQNTRPVWRFFANLFYVNELWFSSIRPFSNGPFWSMGYEFWYYTIFAAAFFLKRWIKFAVVATLCVLVGPKILLLLPVWLLGVLTYKIIKKNLVSDYWGWLLFTGSSFLYGLFRLYDGPDEIYQYLVGCFGIVFMQDYLRWSQEFPSCYIIGVLVAAHFVGAAIVVPKFAKLVGACEKPIRYLAGYSFVLYLFHYPLLQFLGAITLNVESVALRNAIVIFGSLCVIWLMGSITEGRKADWRRWMASLFDFLFGKNLQKSKI